MQSERVNLRAWGVALMTVGAAVAVATSAFGEAWLAFGPGGQIGPRPDAQPEAPHVAVNSYDDGGIQAVVRTAGLSLDSVNTPAGRYAALGCPDTPLAGQDGEPAVPVVRRLFLAPHGAAVEVRTRPGRSVLVDLKASGFNGPVIPFQPPVPMNLREEARSVLICDRAAYARDGYAPGERATVTELGVAGDHGLWLLEVRPVAYNPVRAALRIWPEIDVSVGFHGGRWSDRDLRLPVGLNKVVLNPRPAGPRSGRGGNYLIIVPQAYASTAAMTQFVGGKTAQGFNVTTYVPAPGTTRTEIKNYILSLWGGPNSPGYILIVGDTDPGIWQATSERIPHYSGGGSQHADTDLPYGCMDGTGDWYPEIPVGRFAVRSESQLQAVVNKSLFIEAGVFPDPDYAKRAVFMCGTDAATGDEATHNWVVDTYMTPWGFTSLKLYVRTYGATTQDVRNAFNGGCLYGVFYGHSCDQEWVNGPLFNRTDVGNLTNTGMYAFVLHYTCAMGQFAYVENSFAEVWLRTANAGAAATIGAAGEIYYENNPGWPETSNLEKYTFDALHGDGIHEVGPAWHGALYRLLATYGPTNPVTRDYFEMFNLLGDPALRLPIEAHPDFDVEAAPESLGVCAPADAVYTVEVERIQGFSDLVTLTAVGEPAGTTVNFSQNGLAPPYTSVLTISNTGAASPGNYTIDITGTSGELQRTTHVEMKLATNLAGAVTLVSPQNGAVDVSRLPTLTWQPASQAASYHVEIATDDQFTDVVYTATETGTSHAVSLELDLDTLYYWHVRANNACGTSGYSAPFSFTTVPFSDYFTELFTGARSGFDLAFTKVMFVPDGSPDYYAACAEQAYSFPTDPAGGTVIPLSDNGSKQQFLAESRTVELYNLGYTYFYLGANGYITFLAGDSTYEESLAAHFSLPRISALFDDLAPNVNGMVSWKQLADRVAVTFEGVPQNGVPDSNSFQIEMFFNREIHITYLEIGAADGLVGLSEGLGVPSDYTPTNLSAAGPCPPGVGDMNCDDRADGLDVGPFVLALLDPSQYELLYPDCDIMHGDITGEGYLDQYDVEAFAQLLVGG